jgi:hypothetical protein
MPADYEMIVAASPPVFSHSPPASTFLATNYNYFRYGPTFNTRNNNNHNVRKLSPEVFAKPGKQLPPTISMAPRRPCLVIRAEDCTEEEESQNMRHKKRVVFADDRGLSLTQVRLIMICHLGV